MARMLIRGGRVIDPASGPDGVWDVLLEDGRIAAVAQKIDAGDAEVVAASGRWLAMG